MKYLVTQESTYLDKYEVEANSPEEAKELVLSGMIELKETEYLDSNLDANDLSVFTAEGDSLPAHSPHGDALSTLEAELDANSGFIARGFAI